MSIPHSAIFSPTAARLAASTAKDWNTIDAWLHRITPPGTTLPKFERNPETLRALLALSSLNETADEERDLLFSVERDALRAIDAHKAKLQQQKQEHQQQHDDEPPEARGHPHISIESFATNTLEALESHLPPDASTALTSLANLSLTLNPPPPSPTPAILASRLTELQSKLFTLEQSTARLESLQSYITTETRRSETLLSEIRGRSSGDHDHDDPYAGDSAEAGEESPNPYLPPPTLSKQNLESHRRIKKFTDATPTDDFSASAEDYGSSPPSHPTISQIKDLEDTLKEILARKRALEAEVSTFEGLPTDVDAAKMELDRRRRELAKVTVKRDLVFEGLVERESPVKRRGR